MIKGENVVLRAMEPDDIDVLFSWENNTDYWSVSGTHLPFSRALLEQFVLGENDLFKTGQTRFMICTPNEVPVGTLDLFDFDPINSRVGVGILIAEEQSRNKGLASEAIGLMIKHCFQTIFIHQMFCNIQESNVKSIRLFEKLGFEKTGTKKEWVKSTNGWENVHFYQLINNK